MWRHSPSAASPRPTVCGTQLVGGWAQGSAAPAPSHSWGTCTHPAGGYEKQELRGSQASLLPPPPGAHPSLGGENIFVTHIYAFAGSRMYKYTENCYKPTIMRQASKKKKKMGKDLNKHLA